MSKTVVDIIHFHKNLLIFRFFTRKVKKDVTCVQFWTKIAVFIADPPAAVAFWPFSFASILPLVFLEHSRSNTNWDSNQK